MAKKPTSGKKSRAKAEPQEEQKVTDETKPEGEERKKMTLPLDQVPIDLKPRGKQSISPARIKVVGIGGAGGNAVHRMMQAGLSGVHFIIINTDAQALAQHPATDKIQIGTKVTRGLGAGGDPEVGFKAASESKAEIGEALDDADIGERHRTVQRHPGGWVHHPIEGSTSRWSPI